MEAIASLVDPQDMFFVGIFLTVCFVVLIAAMLYVARRERPHRLAVQQMLDDLPESTRRHEELRKRLEEEAEVEKAKREEDRARLSQHMERVEALLQEISNKLGVRE